jgi:hypothetical protein
MEGVSMRSTDLTIKRDKAVEKMNKIANTLAKQYLQFVKERFGIDEIE